MNLYLENITDQMQKLAGKVEGMNNEREITLTSIHSIGKLSGELVHFSEEMKESLLLQTKAAENLSLQADRLKENMEILNEAVLTFKVEEEGAQQ